MASLSSWHVGAGACMLLGQGQMQYFTPALHQSATVSRQIDAELWGSVVLQTQFYNNLYDSSSQTLLYWMAARLVLTNCLAVSNLLCFDWLVCQSDMLETDRVYITMCLPLHSPPTFVSIWMSLKCVTSVELIWSDTRTLATISSDSMQSGWLVQSFMIGYCVV